MKWALTSPDGLGDFILRLPWLRAMEEAGHDLVLLARGPTLELAGLSGLKCSLEPILTSPYSKHARRLRDPFQRERKRVIQQGVSLVFFGPSQPSFFEQEFAFRLKDIEMGCFVLREDFWPGECFVEPAEIAARCRIQVPVRNTDREPERNAMAAGALLGHPVELPPFQFDSSLQSRLFLPPELEGRNYVVACPGYRSGDYFAGMGSGRWARELRLLEDKLTFVFTGSASETGSNAAIRAGLKNPAKHIDLTGKLEKVADLLGVISGSSGYVGKDSGTMHLSAAMGKPIVAVFGGGHWSRFLPVGATAVVLTVAVSCRGCDWRCHLDEPLCVADISEGSIAKAWGLLEELAVGDVRILEQEPSRMAAAVLAAAPGSGYPGKIHRQRREHLAQERDRLLRFPPLRWVGDCLGRLRGGPS